MDFYKNHIFRFGLLIILIFSKNTTSHSASPAVVCVNNVPYLRKNCRNCLCENQIHKNCVNNCVNKCVNSCVCNKYLKLDKEISPNTTVFAFDLHEVIFSRSYSTIAYEVLRALKNGMVWYLFNPFFLFKAISVSRENRMFEDIYYTLCKDYPSLLKFEEDFFNISNTCCKPINKMVDTIKYLKSLGYNIFLLSNIGFNSYSNFKAKFPDIMSLFDGIYVPGPDNHYHCKPYKPYYLGFINYLKQLGLDNRQIIFIDDLTKNLDTALQVGISGIHCKDTDHVINKLKNLSVI